MIFLMKHILTVPQIDRQEPVKDFRPPMPQPIFPGTCSLQVF